MRGRKPQPAPPFGEMDPSQAQVVLATPKLDGVAGSGIADSQKLVDSILDQSLGSVTVMALHPLCARLPNGPYRPT